MLLSILIDDDDDDGTDNDGGKDVLEISIKFLPVIINNDIATIQNNSTFRDFKKFITAETSDDKEEGEGLLPDILRATTITLLTLLQKTEPRWTAKKDSNLNCHVINWALTLRSNRCQA